MRPCMVDIHCHILPEVDDGAATWEIAVQMCQMAKNDGIDHIVATPHANDEYSYSREQHEERLNRLRALVAGQPQLSLGCDFHLSYENIQDCLLHPERYCIDNTPYLLVEFSDFGLPPNFSALLSDFLGSGIIPIITHPERNPLLQRKPELVLDWAAQGAVVQVTANSLTGRWGPVARRTIEFLLKHSAVHVLATDAHGVTSRRPVLSEAREVVAKMAGAQVAQALVEGNPRAIVKGEELVYRAN
jgi:protein-tyrosine phosphatase